MMLTSQKMEVPSRISDGRFKAFPYPPHSKSQLSDPLFSESPCMNHAQNEMVHSTFCQATTHRNGPFHVPTIHATDLTTTIPGSTCCAILDNK